MAPTARARPCRSAGMGQPRGTAGSHLPALLPGCELCSLGRAEGQCSRHSWLGPKGATVEQAELRWDVAEKAVKHVCSHRHCVMA